MPCELVCVACRNREQWCDTDYEAKDLYHNETKEMKMGQLILIYNLDDCEICGDNRWEWVS